MRRCLRRPPESATCARAILGRAGTPPSAPLTVIQEGAYDDQKSRTSFRTAPALYRPGRRWAGRLSRPQFVGTPGLPPWRRERGVGTLADSGGPSREREFEPRANT